jgi:hypothetical protein
MDKATFIYKKQSNSNKIRVDDNSRVLLYIIEWTLNADTAKL